MTGEVEGVPANNGDKRSIGQRYGAVVRSTISINRLLAQLEANPWIAVMSSPLWDYEAFRDNGTSALCLQTIIWCSSVGEDIYLDADATF